MELIIRQGSFIPGFFRIFTIHRFLNQLNSFDMENENINVEERVVKEVSHPLYSSKGWLKLVGILLLIYGIFAALTIVGLLIAWLPIWLGVLLLQASNRISDAQLTGDKFALIKAQSNLGTYFTIYGVLAILGIIIGVIAFIVGITTGILANLEDFRPDYY
jgi:hypothetical protein